MEDLCVCCGAVVAEGTWVCPNCKATADNAPCLNCIDRKVDCHVYCKKFIGYYKTREKYKDMVRKKQDEETYFINKAKLRKAIKMKRGEL